MRRQGAEERIASMFHSLIGRIAALPGVQSIGRSGGRPLPVTPAGGDIDVFIYCDAIPNEEARRSALAVEDATIGDIAAGAIGGGHWGTGDFVRIDGIETWLMYFTMEEAAAEIDATLGGRFPDKMDNYYYPTGRCAMFQGMEILYDKTGFLEALRKRLAEYPESLARKLTDYHINKLSDIEDLERALARKDVLFYHFALDIALDHFLQALFAMNRVFFPSRKRSLEHIHRFCIRPEKCEKRLLEAIRLGGEPDTMRLSHRLWLELVSDLSLLQGRQG